MIHEINSKKNNLGDYNHLVKVLEKHSNRMYFKTTKDEIEFLHGLIENSIKRKNTGITCSK